MFDKHKKPDEAESIILRIIRPIIAKQLDVPEEDIKPESKVIEDLGADSLDATEIIIALEEKFNIEILDAEIDKIKTISDIVMYLSQRVKV
uniref:Acyl carrier protein n=1 Tax=uncultured microorganism TaxID=358574 RepID=F8UHS2_9ZZZZ|nr:acyl carrier protein [uncultured microorganism]